MHTTTNERVTHARLWGATFVVAFVLAMVVNGLSASGIGVPSTVGDISDAHPVFLTPMSYAFGVWGVSESRTITSACAGARGAPHAVLLTAALPHPRPAPSPVYLLWAVFAVVQLLPSAVRDASYAPLRPLATLAMVLNASWLVLFAYGFFWVALVVIASYLAILVRLVALADVNLMTDLALVRVVPGTWRRVIAHLPFASNASWVLVATLLQLQVALLDEGWFVTEGVSLGLATVVVFAACYQAFTRADLVWAAVAAWALLTIGVNQRPESDWSCYGRICAACARADGLRICARAEPVGWADVCAGESKEAAKGACALEKSSALMHLAFVGTGLVALALLGGVVKGLLAAREQRRRAEAPRGAGMLETSGREACGEPAAEPVLTPGRPVDVASPGA